MRALRLRLITSLSLLAATATARPLLAHATADTARQAAPALHVRGFPALGDGALDRGR